MLLQVPCMIWQILEAIWTLQRPLEGMNDVILAYYNTCQTHKIDVIGVLCAQSRYVTWSYLWLVSSYLRKMDNMEAVLLPKERTDLVSTNRLGHGFLRWFTNYRCFRLEFKIWMTHRAMQLMANINWMWIWFKGTISTECITQRNLLFDIAPTRNSDWICQNTGKSNWIY